MRHLERDIRDTRESFTNPLLQVNLQFLVVFLVGGGGLGAVIRLIDSGPTLNSLTNFKSVD
jgi:hypothetical protein